MVNWSVEIVFTTLDFGWILDGQKTGVLKYVEIVF